MYEVLSFIEKTLYYGNYDMIKLRLGQSINSFYNKLKKILLWKINNT